MKLTVGHISGVHHKAMDYADQADRAKRDGNHDESLDLYLHAFILEKFAAEYHSSHLGYEPTRSVLFRSAATLAGTCGLYEEMNRLAQSGLSGSPPAEIAIELKSLLSGA